MQSGAVTSEAVTSLGGESLFLYSAIARPGNSGGPVLSQHGYVVGLCTEDVTGEYDAATGSPTNASGVDAIRMRGDANVFMGARGRALQGYWVSSRATEAGANPTSPTRSIGR